MTDAEIEAYVDAAAKVIDLPIDPEHRPGILTYFKIVAGLAEQVNDFPLTPEIEPSPVYRP